MNLQRSHDLFPQWTRRETFDRVAAAYMDCKDDAEVARLLSAEAGCQVSATQIHGIRIESAHEAVRQPRDLRRRWIYRFRRLTVNNLVKEYMFMERLTRFLLAKRRLAEEIDRLVKETPPSRLCIAVNDAMGRNDIDMSLLSALQAYAWTAMRIDTFLRPYCVRHKLSMPDGLRLVSQSIAVTQRASIGSRTLRPAIVQLARLLDQDERLFSEEDIQYLMEWYRMGSETVEPENFLSLLARGADMIHSPLTVLDRILADTGEHIPAGELEDFIETLRSQPVRDRDKLLCIQNYTARILHDIEMLKRLGRRKPSPDAQQKAERETLMKLWELTGQQLSLLDSGTGKDD